MKVIWYLPLLCLWPILSACKAPSSAEPDWSRPTTAGGPSAQAGLLTPVGPLETISAGPFTAEVLFPLDARSIEMLVTSDEDKKNVRYTLSPLPGNRWQERMDDGNEAVLARGDDGSLLLISDDQAMENVTVQYEPPMVILPGHLEMGATLSGESVMTVFERGSSRIRDQGTCRYQITLLGQQTVQTALGDVAVVAVQMEREIHLRMAYVTVTIWSAFAPEFGVVAQDSHQRLRILGLLNREQKRALLLSDTDQRNLLRFKD